MAAGIHRRDSLYSNTLDKNIIFIFIIRTKISKPNRIFFAEFNVVIFSKVKDFKWGAVEVWRKPVFSLYYRENIEYIKSNSSSSSAIFFLWDVFSKCPAKISRRIRTPLASVPPFLGGNFLVKSLSVLIAHRSRFSEKKSKWECKNCTSKDILNPIAL